jgi:hypothetical protein
MLKNDPPDVPTERNANCAIGYPQIVPLGRQVIISLLQIVPHERLIDTKK